MFSCTRTASFIPQRHCLDKKLFTSSSTLNHLQLPSQRETHLWYVLPNEVNSESLQNEYLELLPPCEKESVLSLKEGDIRKGALLARVLVRTTIARYQINSQITPGSLKFKKNIHGKPEVDWEHTNSFQPVPLHFNLSHTSSLVACGVTVNSPIGIDVEAKERRTNNNVLLFARRYFSHHEVEVLTSISDPEIQRQEFVKLWTLKEAYVKALGKGFSASPFNTFTIRLNVSGISVEDNIVNKNNKKWEFALLELAGSHYASICKEKDDDNSKGAMEVMVWKTIPCVGEERVCQTDAVEPLGGFT